MKVELNPFDEEYRRIISKPKQFYSIEYFVYYKLLQNKENKF